MVSGRGVDRNAEADEREPASAGEDSFFHLAGPIEPAPGPGTTRAGSFQFFADYVRHLGGDPRGILERHGIDPLCIHDPERHVSTHAMVATFQYCASRLDTPMFGMRLAQRQRPDAFGCVATLCRSAPDLRAALNDFVDYLPVVHSPEYRATLIDDGPDTQLHWFRHSNDYGAYDQVNHHALLRVVTLFRSLAPAGLRLTHASISTSVPHRERADFEDMVGCPVRFDQAADMIGIANAGLDAALPSADRVVHHLLGGYLRRVRLARRHSLRERVEAYVRGRLRSGDCSLRGCAGHLALSPRTLQHQLAAADLSFSRIVADERQAMATAYLRDGVHSIAEVAALLGYAEQSSFGRAFKRWTGRSPARTDE